MCDAHSYECGMMATPGLYHQVHEQCRRVSRARCSNVMSRNGSSPAAPCPAITRGLESSALSPHAAAELSVLFIVGFIQPERALPWAIATSGRLESARPTLELLGVSLEAPVITRDQVLHAKPDPDLFLAAADLLGVPISACVVVGDSVWDLLAARRARALGVGLLSGGYGQDELERAGAYRVYQDPADLLRHFDEVGVRAAE